MARGRRTKEPTPPPPEEEEVEELEEDAEQAGDEMVVAGTGKLHFSSALTWPAGKAIPVAELLRRLKELCEELVELQQEDVSRESLIPKAQELASKQLLQHKDNGVKAYALWCIVEMCRILAPNAPYKQGQLKDIFTLFISHVLPALRNPDDPYNGPHIKILESFNTWKSIILLADISGADILILDLFHQSFDVLAGNVRGSAQHLSKNVGFNLTGILSYLIEQGTSLPEGVIDVLLAQFLRAELSVFPGGKKGEVQISREASPAYSMATAVINTNEEKMVNHIGNYFTSVLIDASDAVAEAKTSKPRGKKRTRDESDDESELGMPTAPSDADLEEVAKAHRLLRELWRSCPGVVRTVVPQIEAELGTDNLQIRVMAVQTVGDMVSGIGAAGPPPPISLDPAAYPSHSLESASNPNTLSFHQIIGAPHAFPSMYLDAYIAFFERHRDKAPLVRSAWVTEAGRIIQTSAGGKGLDLDLKQKLLQGFAETFMDQDEKVRLAAVNAVSDFGFDGIVQKLCESGGVDSKGSVLGHLSERIRDPKASVRTAAVELLAKVWGVAAGAIAEGREYLRELFGWIPARVLNLIYVNDRALNMLVRRVLFESFLPVGYPSIKSKGSADSQRVPDSQSGDDRTPDPDRIRAERLLVFVRDLDVKAKHVFFSLQRLQGNSADYLNSMIDAVEQNDNESSTVVAKLAASLAQTYPEPTTSAFHFEKFFELKDKRCFSLLRFSISPESDYKKVANANKEIIKRLEGASSSIGNCMESFVPLMRSASMLLYNRSMVPHIMAISRTDDNGLATAAHDILKDISSSAPKIFAVHMNELCETLKKRAPSASGEMDTNAVDSLKACAGFARAGHFPADMSKDRTFYQAMVKFAIHGKDPKAAKHAVTITVTSAEKKEMYIKEIVKSCIKNFKAGEGNYLSKLAALGQLRLLASEEVAEHDEAITDIAASLLSATSQDADAMDISIANDSYDDLSGKLLALKCMVNGLRGQTAANQPLTQEARDLSDTVFKLLNTLIEHDGKIHGDASTPENHRTKFRLAAASFILKLCCNRHLDFEFVPADFNRLIKIVQDRELEVRSSFNAALRKYLSQNKLRVRFYGLLFLLAFEPHKEIKEKTVTFLKARVTKFDELNDSKMQVAYAFLISLMAHHPDFSPTAADLEDFVDYILFYLKIVATEKTLPAIYAIAQRVRTVEDAIDPSKTEDLYVLSDLSEAIMRFYADHKSWSLQILPGKAKLPNGIYTAAANSIAMDEAKQKSFLPDDMADNLEDLVKDRLKPKKRKADGDAKRAAKKARTSTASTVKADKPRKSEKVPRATKVTKTPKKRASDALPSSDRRKSTRASGRKSYAELDDSEDDDELEHWQASEGAEDEDQDQDDDEEENKDQDEQSSQVDEAADVEANKENVGSSTPPTSDPTPVPASASKEKEKTTGRRVTPQKKTARPTKAATRQSSRTTTATTSKKPPTRGGGRTKKAADVFDVEGSDEE